MSTTGHNNELKISRISRVGTLRFDLNPLKCGSYTKYNAKALAEITAQRI